MKLINYNLTKFKAEKFENNSKELKINTSIDIKSIKETKNEFIKTKDTILNVKFKYKIKYDPEIAELEFEGNMGLLIDVKKAKEIIEGQKNKKIDENFRMSLFNLILRKTTVKALQSEEELNLPPHFNLPSLKTEKKE